MPQKKVLVVEDETDLASMIGLNLKKEGYLVFSCKTAEQALDGFPVPVPSADLLPEPRPARLDHRHEEATEVIVLARQERPERRLPVARCPDRADRWRSREYR